jgi:hypothetical protein
MARLQREHAGAFRASGSAPLVRRTACTSRHRRGIPAAPDSGKMVPQFGQQAAKRTERRPGDRRQRDGPPADRRASRAARGRHATSAGRCPQASEIDQHRVGAATRFASFAWGSAAVQRRQVPHGTAGGKRSGSSGATPAIDLAFGARKGGGVQRRSSGLLAHRSAQPRSLMPAVRLLNDRNGGANAFAQRPRSLRER